MKKSRSPLASTFLLYSYQHFANPVSHIFEPILRCLVVRRPHVSIRSLGYRFWFCGSHPLDDGMSTLVSMPVLWKISGSVPDGGVSFCSFFLFFWQFLGTITLLNPRFRGRSFTKDPSCVLKSRRDEVMAVGLVPLFLTSKLIQLHKREVCMSLLLSVERKRIV